MTSIPTFPTNAHDAAMVQLASVDEALNKFAGVNTNVEIYKGQMLFAIAQAQMATAEAVLALCDRLDTLTTALRTDR